MELRCVSNERIHFVMQFVNVFEYEGESRAVVHVSQVSIFITFMGK